MKTKTRLTAGKWKQALAFEDNAPNFYTITVGPFGSRTIIANCYTTEADACAMTAAPELLAALEESERTLRWAAQESKGRVKAEVVGGWLHHADQAKAAIAKARGQ